MSEHDEPCYDALLNMISFSQSKLAQAEERLERVESEIHDIIARLNETQEDRVARESFQAQLARDAASTENARIHGRADLQREEAHRASLARIRRVKQTKHNIAERALATLDANVPPRGTVAYDTWKREREPWEDALHELEHGTHAAGWTSDLVEQWLREADIRPKHDQDRMHLLGIRTLDRLIAEQDDRIAAIERRVAAYNLTLDDLRVTS